MRAPLHIYYLVPNAELLVGRNRQSREEGSRRDWSVCILIGWWVCLCSGTGDLSNIIERRGPMSYRKSHAALLGTLLFGLPHLAIGQTLDLSVATIEVNQAIQLGSTTLVGDRATMVRVSVDVAGAGAPVPGVDALMRVYVDDVEIAESPFFSENGPITAPLVVDLENEHDTINFVLLPPVSTNVVFEIEVNPAGPGQLAETDFTNNVLATPMLIFECRRVPEIVFVPMDWRPNNEPDPNLPDPELIKPGVGDGFVQGIYPSKDFNYHRSPQPSLLWIGSPSSAVLTQLNVLRLMMDPIPDHIYGWFPGGVPGNGLGQINGTAAYGNTQPFRHQRTFAHELGHNVGLFHHNGMINTVGVDVEHHLWITEGLPRIKGPDLFDIMVPGLFTEQAWVDSTRYNHFLNHPLFDCAQPDSGSAVGKVFYGAGIRDNQTGAVTLQPLIDLANLAVTEPVAPADADVIVETYANEIKMTELHLKATSSADTCPVCGGGHDSDTPAADAPLSFIVAAESPGGDPIDRMVIKDAKTGDTLDQLSRSRNAPQVSLLTPKDGEVHDGPVTVQWLGSDADGDALTYFLQYSPDGGASFVPLVVYSDSASYGFDTGDVPSSDGDSGLLRLTVTDGFNTYTEEVSGLTLGGGNPPWVFHVTPDDGMTHLRGANMILHASAWDLEDKFMEGASLEWTSDVDGFLGTGRLLTRDDLSVGVHVLTVTGTDSDAMQASDAVTITILDRVLPTLGCDAPQLHVDVNAGGGGDGLSWATAYTDLQDALDHIAACSASGGTVNEIWVAQGTYLPDRGTGDRAETFALSNDVAVYGGFPTGGGDGTFDARDPPVFETTLSGDLAGDDNAWYFYYHGENSYHVVTITGPATLDGLTVRGGNADNAPSDIHGGGVLINGFPTLANCVFKNNRADSLGGGVFFAQWELNSGTVTDCTFENNEADTGGGLWVHGWLTNLIVTRCTFYANEGLTSGGAMYLQLSDLTMTNCGFYSNFSDRGGGLELASSFGANLTNCIFAANWVWNEGGGIYSDGSNLFMTNCTVDGNGASEGAGLWESNSQAPSAIDNCIFWDNATGGGEVTDEDAQITFSSANLLINDNIIQGWTGGGSNFGLDPLFVNAARYYVGTGPGGSLNLRVRDGSPAIDRGNNAALPADLADLDGDGDTTEQIPYDFEDHARVFNGTVDLGAYESDGSRRSYVDSTATGLNDGTSWVDAYTELRDAVDAAGQPNAEIDSIWIAAGTHVPTDGSDRTQTFEMSNGLGIFGGFPNGGGDGTFDARDPAAFETMLSGDLNGNDLPLFINYDENSYHVVTINGYAYVDGVTIEGGNANSTEVDPVYGYPIDIDGGGVFLNGVGTLTGCVIKNNRADRTGGGVHFDQWELVKSRITDSTIRGNEADEGGGVWVYGWLCEFTMTRCTVVDNFATSGAGGMYSWFTEVIVTNSSFLGNGTLGNGGGLALDGVWSHTMANSIFSGNFSLLSGGGIAADGTNLLMTNCSLSRNFAGDSGAGLWEMYGDGSIDNSIFWENSVNGVMDQDAQITFTSPTLLINDNIIQGWTGGGTNFSADPLFVDADGFDNVEGTVDDNLRLLSGSPAVDIGNNAALPTDLADLDADGNVSEQLPYDLDDTTRIQGGTVDLGAYERVPPPPPPKGGKLDIHEIAEP